MLDEWINKAWLKTISLVWSDIYHKIKRKNKFLIQWTWQIRSIKIYCCFVYFFWSYGLYQPKHHNINSQHLLFLEAFDSIKYKPSNIFYNHHTCKLMHLGKIFSLTGVISIGIVCSDIYKTKSINLRITETKAFLQRIKLFVSSFVNVSKQSRIKEIDVCF